MAGRKAVPGAERFEERLTIRWSTNDVRRLKALAEHQGYTYIADVVRALTLQKLDEIERDLFGDVQS